MKQIFVAQKALVLDKTKTKLLANKYLEAKYIIVRGKLGLPGGKMNFGEKPLETLIREVVEETGITIKPILPFYTWTWIYKKENEKIQIVATCWLAHHSSGSIKDPKPEEESKLQRAKWIKIKKDIIKEFIEDEQPIIRKFLEYKKKNPFTPHKC